MISLTTRPLAWGGKVWAHAYNDVMEWFSHMFTVTNCYRYGKSLCYALLLATVWQGSNEQDSSDHMHSIATNR